MRITFLLPEENMSGGIKVVAICARMMANHGYDIVLVPPPPMLVPLRSKLRSLIKGKGWSSPLTRPKSRLNNLDLNHHVLDRWCAPTDEDVPNGDVVVATWRETAKSPAI
jgi:hypothetical protein